MTEIEEINRYTLPVKFTTTEQVKNFILQAEELIGEITIESNNNHTVDGRSLVGILNLDVSKPVTVVCDNRNFREIYKLCNELKIIEE